MSAPTEVGQISSTNPRMARLHDQIWAPERQDGRSMQHVANALVEAHQSASRVMSSAAPLATSAETPPPVMDPRSNRQIQAPQLPAGKNQQHRARGRRPGVLHSIRSSHGALHPLDGQEKPDPAESDQIQPSPPASSSQPPPQPYQRCAKPPRRQLSTPTAHRAAGNWIGRRRPKLPPKES